MLTQIPISQLGTAQAIHSLAIQNMTDVSGTILVNSFIWFFLLPLPSDFLIPLALYIEIQLHNVSYHFIY